MSLYDRPDLKVCLLWWCFFFFKQKTAYEVRISDWSSDVCSSDLFAAVGAGHRAAQNALQIATFLTALDADIVAGQPDAILFGKDAAEIGRASGRERVCQYV